MEWDYTFVIGAPCWSLRYLFRFLILTLRSYRFGEHDWNACACYQKWTELLAFLWGAWDWPHLQLASSASMFCKLPLDFKTGEPPTPQLACVSILYRWFITYLQNETSQKLAFHWKQNKGKKVNLDYQRCSKAKAVRYEQQHKVLMTAAFVK